jgi:hypothetical protein
MSGPYKLVYFNIPARAEAIRLTFALGDIPFEVSHFMVAHPQVLG